MNKPKFSKKDFWILSLPLIFLVALYLGFEWKIFNNFLEFLSGKFHLNFVYNITIGKKEVGSILGIYCILLNFDIVFQTFLNTIANNIEPKCNHNSLDRLLSDIFLFPILEEIIFRYIPLILLLKLFESKITFFILLFFSSYFWSFAHTYNYQKNNLATLKVSPLFFFGLFYSFILFNYGLFYCVTMHAVHNMYAHACTYFVKILSKEV